MTEYKCGSAKQCQYGDMCKPLYDIGGCSHYREKRPQTNDEWRRTCSAEEFAEWLSKISKFFHECGKRDVYPKTMYEEDWECWLKQPHGGE